MGFLVRVIRGNKGIRTPKGGGAGGRGSGEVKAP